MRTDSQFRKEVDSISVDINGYEAEETSYREANGELTIELPEMDEDEGWEAMRVTITAKDASGNIARASVDIPASDETRKFTDVDAAWGDFLYTAGITNGYEDGTYRPDNLITRAQFSALLYRYLRLDEADYEDVVLPFADLDQIPAYALPAVRALYTEGASAMIGRTLEKGYPTANMGWPDSAAIPGYAAYYLQMMSAQGCIAAFSDGTLRPNTPITRGQVAQILYGFL